MAQLIQMRQRIKAIDTIKKITHAMRLISMSTHSHLKNKERSLVAYTTAIKQLFIHIKKQTPDWKNRIVEPSPLQQKQSLVIIISSQKGLCGNFNASLFKLFESQQASLFQGDSYYIAVGKKSIEFMHHKKNIIPIELHAEFSLSRSLAISESITQHIMMGSYTHITVVSTLAKTFFIQKPHIYSLVPLNIPDDSDALTNLEYSWEQSPEEILDLLIYQYIKATIHNLLFQSLLAEQAARFISMDNSTRNAESLLDSTKLQYNKFRQTKITRELSELTGNL